MKIYTKTGDKGESSLFGGGRVLKNHWRLEAYGTFDELNSFIGKAISELYDCGLISKMPVHTERELLEIQSHLFNLGSHLACEDSEMQKHLPTLSPESTNQLETAIDNMNTSLTPLKNFILPGGNSAASTLHIARTVARRAERRLLDGDQNNPAVQTAIVYINRLSDYLFVVARFVNFHAGIKDVAWMGK